MKKSTEKRLARGAFLLLMLLALIFRTANPQFNPLTHVNVNGDEARVLAIARNVAERGEFAYNEGLGDYELSMPMAFLTGPLTVYTHAAFFWAFGSSYAVARLTVALFGMIDVVLIFLIARRVYGARAAKICAVIASMDPVFSFYSRVALHDILCYMFFLLSIYVMLDIQKRTYLRMFALGVFAGLASIAKYNGIIILGVVLLYAIYKRRMKALMELPVAIAGCLLVFAVFYAWLYTGGFLDMFMLTFFEDMFASGVSASTGIYATQGIPGLVQILIRYLPFLLIATVAGITVVAKRGFRNDGEKLLLIWMLVGFVWWTQSFASGKYTMAFTFPMFIFVSGAMAKIMKEPAAIGFGKGKKRRDIMIGKAHVIVFLALMVLFCITVNIEALNDFRDDSVYRMSEIVKSSPERVLFAEPPIAFVSGLSQFPYFWNDSASYWIGQDLHLEMRYENPNNQSIHDYLFREKPRFVMLNMNFLMGSTTPRKEFMMYTEKYGRFYDRAGPFIIYEMQWPESADRKMNVTFKWRD